MAFHFVNIFLSVILVVFLESRVSSSSPIYDYQACNSSDDCGDFGCCVLSNTRFSTPQCRSRGNIGNYCISDSSPVNRTLFYPSGEVLSFENIYVMFCPCHHGYACIQSTCQQDLKMTVFTTGVDDYTVANEI